jgi:pyruvate kinase
VDRSRTKLVCTIGPASFERVGELVAAGMDVARVNFSHGTPDDHRAYVHAVRSAAHSARRSVAVMVDLPGPKIRVGDLEGGAITLETGAAFVLRPPAQEGEEAAVGNNSAASVSTAGLASQLEVGDRVLLADGAAELHVTGVNESDVETEVVHGGTIRSRSGVNIPSSRLTGDGLTDEDRAAVPRALELRADLIAQSFVRNADDVRALRALLPADGPRLVAKIETRAAVDGFDGIAEAADGIMVARGDLGVDIPFEEVPLAQKDLIQRASRAGRFSIVATQMLESMISAPRPTRAEASDVANAVLDGADAVMLSAETAIGQFPVEALQAMAKICAKTERNGGDLMHSADPPAENAPADSIIAAATYIASRDGEGSGGIWCFTRSGRTVERLSLQRPGIPIVAFTLSPVVARRLAVRHGVVPLILSTSGSGPLFERMEQTWRAQRDRDGYDTVVLVTTSSQPEGINRLEIHHLSEQVAARQ